MISQNEEGDEFTVQCDLCSNSDTFEVSLYTDCVREMKYAGWTFKRIDEFWKHVCPSCVEEIKIRLQS